jgi:Tripartite tricarboxylate transporter TctB family
MLCTTMESIWADVLEVMLRHIRHPDRISGVFLATVALIAVVEASHLPFGSIAAPDAGFFPLSLSALLLIFAVVIVAASFIGSSPVLEFSMRTWSVVLAACAFILYALAIPKAGFVISTTAVLFLLLRGFGGIGWTRSFLIAVPMVLLTYLAFVRLGVPLPAGPLPF